MKTHLFPVLFLLLVLACTSEAPPNEPPLIGQWYDLLEDKNLGDWEKMGDFSTNVSEDVLYLEAQANEQNAWLLTKETFSNFHLEVEFQMDSLQSSGLIFRYDDRLRTLPEQAGYKVSLNYNADEVNPLGTILHTARAKIPENLHPEDWQKINIEVHGDYLKILLNGELLAEAHDRRRAFGKIGLMTPQAAGGKIAFRKLRLKPLAESSPTEPLLMDAYRKAAKDQMEALFDGKTFSGWEATGDGSWEIEDGVLHGYSGEKGGFLVNEKVYKNFYLTAKFKIIKGDNSGIFIRKSPDRPDVSLEDAIECNIYDFNGPGHLYSTGAIVSFARAWYGMIDYEGWNTMEIFARNDHIILAINDRKAAEAHLPDTYNKAGNICLQAGYQIFSEEKGPSDIYFKDVFVKNMDDI